MSRFDRGPPGTHNTLASYMESKAAIEALQKEAARAVEDAPRYYTEQVDNAVAELLAKPKAMLEDAKAASDEALSAAKATRDGLQKK